VSPVEAGCPACGAPVTFKFSTSIVTVCDYCKSVVARGDKKFEDLGKVADIVESGSPLDIGLRGVYRDVAFELTGRAQLGHSAGGMWDEWYAAFADGKWGWLAEAQGRFYLTFELSLSDGNALPHFEELQLGQPVAPVQGAFALTVAEKGVARMLGAKGEIPYKLEPSASYSFADLSGPEGEFGTIDYSEDLPIVFIGREVTLQELGLSEAAAPEREPRRVDAIHLSCPQCGGALDLRAPDKTERVTCPHCASLLNVSEGKLRFFSALKPGKVVPVIPIGSVGEFEGARLTVIGFMQRSVEFEGVRYYWEEYLLYEPRVGFRWLVRSDDHWSFVQTVGAGEVSAAGKHARFRGMRFKLFQDAMARVEHVVGEFYWRVAVGEMAHTADFIKPPYILSREISTSTPAVMSAAPAPEQTKGRKKNRRASVAETGEVNWSLGAYLDRREVEKTFGVSGLPRPSTVAPNQVFPHKKIYKYWLMMLALVIFFGLIIFATGSNRKVYEQTFQLQPPAEAQKPQVVFTDPVDIRGRQNIRVSAASSVDNSWLFIDGDFVNEETGLVQQFALPVEYYHGVEGGESWSEGDRSPDVYLSALPAGKYTMRLEVSWEKWQFPAVVTVRVTQGVPRFLHLLLALIAVSIVPFFVLLRHYSFERRRWKDSDYSPFQSS
jgi:hypothetical protein